jgi:hypothetical protein
MPRETTAKDLESVRPSCAPGRIRTCDLRLRRPTLYPAELQALELLRHSFFPASLPNRPSGRFLLQNSFESSANLDHFAFRLGWMTGIEPATPGTTNQCSTTELHPPNLATFIVLSAARARNEALGAVFFAHGPASAAPGVAWGTAWRCVRPQYRRAHSASTMPAEMDTG